jgi:hypothetical protein
MAEVGESESPIKLVKVGEVSRDLVELPFEGPV